MSWKITLAGVVAAFVLTACGTTSGDRTLSGAAIGAGTGLVVGGPVGAGVGAVAGAATGRNTDAEDVNLGKPIWN